jgi:hypothetical protein
MLVHVHTVHVQDLYINSFILICVEGGTCTQLTAAGRLGGALTLTNLDA